VDAEGTTVSGDEEETIEDLVCESGDGDCAEGREGTVQVE
jgi:hypothetical protein